MSISVAVSTLGRLALSRSIEARILADHVTPSRAMSITDASTHSVLMAPHGFRADFDGCGDDRDDLDGTVGLDAGNPG